MMLTEDIDLEDIAFHLYNGYNEKEYFQYRVKKYSSNEVLSPVLDQLRLYGFKKAFAGSYRVAFVAKDWVVKASKLLDHKASIGYDPYYEMARYNRIAENQPELFQYLPETKLFPGHPFLLQRRYDTSVEAVQQV